MRLGVLGFALPAFFVFDGAVMAQLDSERSMRNPSLAPRARVSGQDRASETPTYVPPDRQPTSIERQQRKNFTEDRNLELRSELPRYSRERQQVRDRTYRDFRDVEFISATLKRNQAPGGGE